MTPRSHPPLAWLLCLFVLTSGTWMLGCSSDADSPADGGAAGDGGTSAGAEALAGFVKVTLLEPVLPTDTPATSIAAYFYDRLPPPPLPLELANEAGDCRLMVPSNPFCDPACEDALCTEDGVCTPFARARSAGTVRVSGLGDGELTIDPVGPKFVYQGATLPNPPCEQGVEIRAQADGFTLTAPCIAPFELTTPPPIVVASDQPIALAWVPPRDPEGSRVEIVLDIAHHGGQTGEIVCNVPDTGATEIPATLVTELIELGVAGYPTIAISRLATQTATQEPDVALIVASPISRAVDTGVASCGDPTLCTPGAPCEESCPVGTTCQDDLICR